MADLAEEGYLSQPHTSAGRIPTQKAFQHYVSTLTARRLVNAETERLRVELSDIHTLEERVERTSHLLTEITRNMGIAAAQASVAQSLDQIELVLLGECRVLVVLVTRDHMVHERVVALDEAVKPDDLVSIRNYINVNFAGWRLPDARRELLRRMAEDRAQYDAMLGKLGMLCQKGLLEVDNSPEVHMEGASNLLGLDLHLTRDRMRDLLRALEEKKRIIELLDRFLEQPAGELGIHVGLGAAHPSMSELALIGISFQLPSGLAARVAVLGPMRMHYERVMSAVWHMGQALAGSRF